LSAGDQPVLTSYAGQETVSIFISESDEIFIDGTEASLATLPETLNQKIPGRKEHVIITIEGEDKTKMGQVLNVQKVLRESDLLRIAYMNASGFQLNLVLPPQGSEEKLGQIDADNLLHVQLMGNGDVYVDRNIIKKTAFEEILRQKLTDNKFIIVVILALPQA